MKPLWPRLPRPIADELYLDLEAGHTLKPADGHPSQVYSQVGGRVPVCDIANLQTEMRAVAAAFGYLERLPSREERIAFDREAAVRLRAKIDIAWSEAGSRELWSFVSLVALPDVTEWRWSHTLPKRNKERWVASDLTRHTWARLWWQAVVFAEAPEVLEAFNESELNQLLERRAIGGHPRLLVAIAKELLNAIEAGVPRRAIIRDATRRLRRRLAFVDDLALDEAHLATFAQAVVHESWAVLADRAPGEWRAAHLVEDKDDPDL